MKVGRVQAQNFMSHDNLDVTLPPTGVVLVTGLNGAGKSAIMEAVAYGYWGKTLRGSDPRRGGDEPGGLVGCESDLVSVGRRWKGGSSASKLEVVGEQHENSTKAQDRVSDLLSWDVWRRSCAFSSADAAHFTLAADADRKRLLEAILGLDRLDIAHEAARKDLRQAEQKHTATGMATNRILGALDVARATLAKRSEMPKPPRVTVKEITSAHQLAQRQEAQAAAVVDKLRKQASDAQADLRTAEAAVLAAERVLAKLGQAECPTCARPFSLDRECQAKAMLELEQETERRGHRQVALAAITSHGIEAVQKQKVLHEQTEKAALHLTLIEREWFTYTQAAQLRDEAQDHLTELELDQMDAESAQYEAASQVALLEACCLVLGTRGVRSQVLASALGDLETAANRWLAEIGDRDLKVTIRPQVERASGTVADVVTMEVAGAGGGRGYKGASAGERRRIDVAIMLALAEMAGRAHGTSGSTLFFDEVFDALDVDGSRAVAQALGKLAQDRCVVVISHSTALASELSPGLSIVVEDGEARVRSR